MRSHLLALDQGTTSSRAILFDANGTLITVSQREFKQHFPSPGYVEHDPEEIVSTQLAVAHEALAQAGLSAQDIAAIGITNQRETCLLWDRSTGEAVTPAIVWQDRRTAEHCESLRADGHETMLQERSGLLLDPYFSASKLAWLLDNDDGLRARADAGELAAGTIDTWLIWQLTEGALHVTDPSNASRTALYNIRDGSWDDDLLALWKLPASLLPEIVDSSGVCGETRMLGEAAIPIAGIAGDQQAALFGQACFEPGMAKCTYGTGCFILMQTGAEPVASNSRLLSTVAWSVDGKLEYALEGSVFMGGAIIQWLRDGLGIINKASEVEELANSVPDTDGLVLMPAFTGLGAPHWLPETRAALFGMTRGTTKAHIARAALNAIAMQVGDVCDAMLKDAPSTLKELRVDGGASANALLMQIQSDVLNCALMRPRLTECTAWGAAALAGLGVGLWSSRDELARLWQADAHFEPSGQLQSALSRSTWKAAIQSVSNWSHNVQLD